MRSGVIARKIGMTRVFNDTGEHVPVTVLKLDDVQVVAQKTKERDGYTGAAVGCRYCKGQKCIKGDAGPLWQRQLFCPNKSWRNFASVMMQWWMLAQHFARHILCRVRKSMRLASLRAKVLQVR